MGLLECPKGHRFIIAKLDRRKWFSCPQCKKKHYRRSELKMIRGIVGMRRSIDYGFIDKRPEGRVRSSY